ncbi:MAG: 1-acyl-sn-glycerol-3-phosphate acyltransferase [Planctomycetaceae bacterium]|jgi:1-acyl-sn-glycerol-3-phosphate acyltransferase|nr:1-acyl-sn-glycerol-3-phosphate acyltransferase [Planctomycetaceae bacterium]
MENKENNSSQKTPDKKQSRRGVRVITWKMRAWYSVCKFFVQIIMLLVFRLRTYGVKHTEIRGGALIVSNHQSYLDPLAIGARIRGKINYLARKGLFRFKPFAQLIESFDAIPLDQEGIGYEGIKETFKRLKNGERVLIFPEGARTLDENGEIMPFKRGVMSLAVRAKSAIIPAAIAGAFETWPRYQKFPHLFPDRKNAIRVIFSEPIPYEQAAAMPEDELHEYVEKRVRELYEQIRRF